MITKNKSGQTGVEPWYGSRKGHAVFWLCFLLFSTIVAASRFYWIWRSELAQARVIAIGKQRLGIYGAEYFPLFQYSVGEKQVQSRGDFNTLLDPGREVEIRYHPQRVEEFRINEPYWLWFDIWSWYRLVLVVICLYYIVLVVVKMPVRVRYAKLEE